MNAPVASVVSALLKSPVPLDPLPVVPAAYNCTDAPIKGCWPASALPMKLNPLPAEVVETGGFASTSVIELPQPANPKDKAPSTSVEANGMEDREISRRRQGPIGC
jgi:hypothetical protein